MNAPDLAVGNEFYFVAFNDLASCRLYENGMVPWTAIKDYASEYDITGEQKELLFEVTRELDAWYMERQEAKSKRENKAGKTKPSGKRL